MENRLPFKPGSLLFAPMEGVTEESYRIAVSRAFPEWDLFATDFLRVPSQGFYKTQKILSHFGESVYQNEALKKKTTFQILTSERANTIQTVELIEALGFEHLDLNLGCPSKKVNAHKGGAYLLSDLPVLRKILKDIRSHFNKCFTVKIRIGYRDTSNFEDLLKLIEDEGVEAITIHGRTRDQLYRGHADWSYIKKAVELSNLPIIGNGDVWNTDDVTRMFEETGCHSVMAARGALKTPWLATLYRDYEGELNEAFLMIERKKFVEIYFYELEKEYRREGKKTENILKRFKALSRYIFDDFDEDGLLRDSFLRSRSYNEFSDKLGSLFL
ncbi:MAG: nifR3 family TIM-barrel protein [Bacteriovoracaceae bacterium]|jgi:nifR3 family TIM-barrel protein